MPGLHTVGEEGVCMLGSESGTDHTQFNCHVFCRHVKQETDFGGDAIGLANAGVAYSWGGGCVVWLNAGIEFEIDVPARCAEVCCRCCRSTSPTG